MQTMFRRISFALCMAVCVACASPRDFVADDADGGASDVSVVSVAALKTMYRGYPLPITREVQIRGVVTANDLYGGMRRAVMLQDATGGIEVKISGERLYKTFPFGRWVRVRCCGLVLGGYGGMVSMGAVSDDEAYENGFIAEPDRSAHLFALDSIEDVRPDTLSMASLGGNDIGRYVAFRRVQFIEEEVGLCWCDDLRDTDRHLIDPQGDTLVVRTRGDADFAAWPVPHGSGYIEGIMERFGKTFQLRIVRPRAAAMSYARFKVE